MQHTHSLTKKQEPLCRLLQSLLYHQFSKLGTYHKPDRVTQSMLFNYIDLIFIDFMTKLVFILKKIHFFKKYFFILLKKKILKSISDISMAYSFIKRIAGLCWCPLRKRVIGSHEHQRLHLLTTIDLIFYFHFVDMWS